jgi:DnaJ-class molecular chaperone
MTTVRAKVERCDQCNGRKKKVGLGGMPKDCDKCKGIGWLEPKEPVESKPVEIDGLKNVNGEPVKAVKRKGRPPRTQEFNL